MKRFLFTCLVAIITAATAGAQPAGTGTLSGRIFNPATGEYVRNAEIQVEGTNLVAYSPATTVRTSSPACPPARPRSPSLTPATIASRPA